MENNAYGVVYKITNIINNKIYIGQTKQDPRKRFKHHITISKRKCDKYDCGMVIIKAMRKHGYKNFKFEIIDIAYSRKELNLLEGFYIFKFKSLTTEHGYNILKISTDGRQCTSNETKQKLSIWGKSERNLKILDETRNTVRKTSKTNGFLGIEPKRNKWSVRLSYDNKRINGGVYENKIDAAKVADLIELKNIKNNPKLNFPELKEKYLNNEIFVIRSLKYGKTKIVNYKTLDQFF